MITLIVAVVLVIPLVGAAIMLALMLVSTEVTKW